MQITLPILCPSNDREPAPANDLEPTQESRRAFDFDAIARNGSMSREEAAEAKWHGVYASRQPGAYMARVVVPGGRITSAQARALAEIAGQYSRGRIALTTRQSIQFHNLKLEEISAMRRDVEATGLSTFHGCGDVTRNVAACPRASICPHRRMDVMPYVQATAEWLTACRDLDNLPRKFKITFSGCGGDCGQPHINCAGVIAISRRLPDGTLEPGFRVVIGGGMGWKGFVAQPLYGFVPPERIVDVCRAIGLLFNDHGIRTARRYSRLKFVVDQLGVDYCRELIEEYLDRENVDRGGFVIEPVEDCGPPVPACPLSEPEFADADGLAIQQIKIPKGELGSDRLAKIADLADRYGDQHVYVTNRQNLELHGIDPNRAFELRSEVVSLGFEAKDFFGLTDIVSCVGTTHCPMALSRTHAMFDQIQKLVGRRKYAPIRDKAILNISGCRNGCSPYRIVDIGLQGTRIRQRSGSNDGYRITIGGTQTSFGRPVGEFTMDDCTRVVATILDTFLNLGDGKERLADNVARFGIEPYVQAIEILGIEYDTPGPSEDVAHGNRSARDVA